MPPIAAGSINYSFFLNRGLLPTSKCFCIACNRAKHICLSAKTLHFCEPASTFSHACCLNHIKEVCHVLFPTHHASSQRRKSRGSWKSAMTKRNWLFQFSIVFLEKSLSCQFTSFTGWLTLLIWAPGSNFDTIRWKIQSKLNYEYN